MFKHKMSPIVSNNTLHVKFSSKLIQ
jgi:hypothetical protein